MAVLVTYSLATGNLCYLYIVHCCSDTTKDVLIASTYVHLKCYKFTKYASDLPTVSPRILLSGPAGGSAFLC